MNPEVGHLDPEARPTAEMSAWAAVHGLSLLLIDGPLQALPADQRDEVIDRTLRMVSRGLAREAGPDQSSVPTRSTRSATES